MSDRPVRAYSVCVDGYAPMLYSARTPAKARWRCYRDYQVVSSKSFGEFLAISTIRRVDDPPGAHQRILVCGKPATRVIGRGNGIYFMWDGSDEILTCHPTEMQEIPHSCPPGSAAEPRSGVATPPLSPTRS